MAWIWHISLSIHGLVTICQVELLNQHYLCGRSLRWWRTLADPQKRPGAQKDHTGRKLTSSIIPYVYLYIEVDNIYYTYLCGDEHPQISLDTMNCPYSDILLIPWAPSFVLAPRRPFCTRTRSEQEHWGFATWLAVQMLGNRKPQNEEWNMRSNHWVIIFKTKTFLFFFHKIN